MTEEKKSVLRESNNKVHIEGLVKEIKLEEREIKGKDALAGEIDVEVSEFEVHTLNFFAYKFKNDNTENGIYTSLQTVMNEYKSIITHGKEEADAVRVDSAKLGVNDYYKDGNLRTFPQINAAFINRIARDEDFKPQATFKTEVFISRLTPERKGQEETGRAQLDAIIPGYKGKAIPFTFKAPEDIADFLLENYSAHQTIELWGDIINKKEFKTETTAAGFGQEKTITKEIVQREFLLSGGTDAYEEDDSNTYDPVLIKASLTEREIMLEDKKKESEKKANKKGGNKGQADKKAAFKSRDKEANTGIDISDDDLPF
ncbi:hypothetical protein [Bacillus sp. Marseille-P3800]|uniref:hypothetical protein n=1 Tax=Bacillus sp. Marseille-P3800 TaxID=2014782 RepID=UPI000C06D77F|nr:hypothetical protein [Bacillus sp. Marseille-P3800]